MGDSVKSYIGMKFISHERRTLYKYMAQQILYDRYN